MTLRDITRTAVESALEEFRRLGLDAMLKKYHGGPSTEWYVEEGNWVYDQKLLLRAAHVHQKLGEVPLKGPGGFTAAHATRRLESLDYRVVGKREASNANLKSPKATEPLMQWLIGAAGQRLTLTYGEAAARLEHECGFNPIGRRTRMGIVVGNMQYAIYGLDASAPLLHVLLVRSSGTRAEIGKPGDGAGVFLIRRFPDEDRLRESNVRREQPDVWAEFVGRATHEVYNYRGWETLYRRLYGEYVPDPYYATPPAEDDGVPRGGSGEGPNHKALRLWVMENPGEVDWRFRGATARTEEELLSGDRVDVVYFTDEEVLAIEVKSRDSNPTDLLRGIYQCIKYGAVLRAQEDGGRTVRTLLVTETGLPEDLVRLAKRLDVRQRCVELPSQ